MSAARIAADRNARALHHGRPEFHLSPRQHCRHPQKGTDEEQLMICMLAQKKISPEEADRLPSAWQ
jgi:hypothetical protein